MIRRPSCVLYKKMNMKSDCTFFAQYEANLEPKLIVLGPVRSDSGKSVYNLCLFCQ